MPIAGTRRVDRAAPRRRTGTDPVFPRGLDRPRRHRGHRLPEQGGRLCPAVPDGGRDPTDDRRRSPASRRGDWLLRRVAHVGPDAGASSPSALRRAGRRSLA